MKRLIKWLADISGVTDQIEKETAISIGYRMHDASRWIASKKNLAKVIDTYAEYLKKGQLNLYGNQFEKWRNDVSS